MTHKSIRNNNKQTEDDTTDSELDLTGTVMTAFYIGLFTEKGLGHSTIHSSSATAYFSITALFIFLTKETFFREGNWIKRILFLSKTTK